LNYKIFRCHNVFGTHQNRLDKFRNVIGIFISCLLGGKPLPIFGDGHQVRQFTPVEYVVEGLVSDNVPWDGIYNIGSDQSYTIKEIADALIDCCIPIHPYNFVYHAARHEATHPICNHSKIQQYIGECKYDLKEELTKIVEWARTDKGFESILPKIEIERGLPEAWK